MAAPVTISSNIAAACDQCQIRSYGEYTCSRIFRESSLRPRLLYARHRIPAWVPAPSTTPNTIKLPSQLTKGQRSWPSTYNPAPAVDGRNTSVWFSRATEPCNSTPLSPTSSGRTPPGTREANSMGSPSRESARWQVPQSRVAPLAGPTP